MKPLAADGLPSLIGLDVAGLERVLGEIEDAGPQTRLRARQLFHWLYHRGAASFEASSGQKPPSSATPRNRPRSASIRPQVR